MREKIAKYQREERDILQKQKKAERNRTMRKHSLMGEWLQSQVDQQRDGWSEEKLIDVLDAFLRNPRDRKLFGLPELEQNND
ncbi:putative mobilization protein [Magnetofaba australis IT-1]|uniref:Putative mobilization protein n=1 Tax=Magnetofaba australis IT-1 TaxID=1434232 RepID=A0A1Y2KAC0_9PROT|nr:putative mobilization protein [Magnetofaba australis IT-1]